MEKKLLKNKNIEISPIGIGGFHLVETPLKEVEKILNTYLDEGGNYIETAAQYGNGLSEIKIGKSVSSRRDEYILATKTHIRDKKGALKTFERSLKNLKADYVDILFIHEPLQPDVLKKVISKDGSLEAAIQLKEKGLVKYIGISGHGYPKMLIKAFDVFNFDALLINVNYFDNLNFPEIQNILIPKARQKNSIIFAMKALADGLLYHNTEDAIRYTLTQDIDCLVLGINKLDYLYKDIEIVKKFKPITNNELEDILKNDQLLSNYVCRQCKKCLVCPLDINIAEIFRIEGIFDRQLYDGIIRDPKEYWLRETLRFWFNDKEFAYKEYEKLKVKADKCNECGQCLDKCPYNINIIDKLKICHFKLSKDSKDF